MCKSYRLSGSFLFFNQIAIFQLMKPILFLLTALSAMLLYACQKQLNWNIDPITREVNGDSLSTQFPSLGRLVKVVAKTGNQMFETTYSYDSIGRLQGESKSGIENGQAVQDFTRYTRDTAGKIIKITSISKNQVDSAVIVVNYDDYYPNIIQYVLSTFTEQGKLVKDSMINTYDGNGNIAIQKTYRKASATYSLFHKNEYAYSAGNLTLKKIYVDSSSTGIMVLNDTYQFTYDNKLNPLHLSIEALLKNKPELTSINNVTATEIGHRTTPANNSQIISKLTYGGSRKPLSCISTKLPAGEVTQMQFFYQ